MPGLTRPGSGRSGRTQRPRLLIAVLDGIAVARPGRRQARRRAELVVAGVLAAAGAGIAVCLPVVMVAPFVTVIGYETLGHRHQRQMLNDLAAGDSRRSDRLE